MKKIITGILILAMLLTQFLMADTLKIGDDVGDILDTDIKASINGYLVPTHNIGTSLVVYAKDLRNYGFYVEWLPEERRVNISKTSGQLITPMEVQPNPNAKVGNKIGDVLYTDIKTCINGNEIISYNINGSTAILFRDLKAFGEVYFYEKERFATLCMTAVWDESKIIAELKQYKDNIKTKFTIDKYYKPNDVFIKDNDIYEAIYSVEIAENIVKSANNLNYATIGDEFIYDYLYYRMPGIGIDYEKEVNDLVKTVKDNNIVKQGYFVSDTSLIYISRDLQARIRGRYIFQYQSPTNIEYLKTQSPTLEVGKWYYIDLEVMVAQFFSKELYKWEHSIQTHEGTIEISDIRELRL